MNGTCCGPFWFVFFLEIKLKVPVVSIFEYDNSQFCSWGSSSSREGVLNSPNWRFSKTGPRPTLRNAPIPLHTFLAPEIIWPLKISLLSLYYVNATISRLLEAARRSQVQEKCGSCAGGWDGDWFMKTFRSQNFKNPLGDPEMYQNDIK